MGKQIETLVEDIQNLFLHGHSVNSNLSSLLAENIVSSLEKSLTKKDPDEFWIRFSQLGKKDRQLWYSSKGSQIPKERFHPNTLIKFSYGNLLEDYLLYLAKEAGHVVEKEQHSMEYLGVTGSCDAVIDGVVVDVKTASNYGFKKFVEGTIVDDDPFGYLPQLSAYAQTLGIERGGFLVINKETGALCYTEIDPEILASFDLEARIEHQKNVVKMEEPPDKCFDPVPQVKPPKTDNGNRVLPTECKYCQFKFECWKDSNEGQGLRTFVYSTGPQYFTHVEKEPKVPENFPVVNLAD